MSANRCDERVPGVARSMTEPAQPDVNAVDRQWARLYNAFDHTEGLDATLHKLTALACTLSPWYASAVVAIDKEGGFIERLAETGERAPIFALLPTRWPLQTSPCRELMRTGENLIITDVGACRDYPLYQAEAVAQAYRGVGLMPCGSDGAGRPLALSVHSREAVEDSDDMRELLSRLACIARGEILRAKACDAEQARLRRMERYAGLGAELMESVLGGRSASEVVGQMAHNAGFRLALLDIPAQRAYFTHAKDEALAPALLADWHNRGTASTHSPSGTVALSEPIVIEGRLAGAVIYLDGTIAADEVRYLLLHVKSALSSLLLRSHLHAVGMAAGLKSIFETLATGEWQNSQVFASSARHLGLDPAAPAQLFALNMDAGVAADAPERLAHPLASCCPGAVCGRAADLLLIYVPCPSDGLSSTMKQRIAQIVNDTLSLSARALAESPVITAIEAYPGAIRTLRHVLRLAQALGRSGRVTMATFDPFAFLAATLDKNAAPEFITSTLGQIRRYDTTHSTRFVDTCMAFGESGCRYQETADRLHIHVSTLRYRIARISELFNIQLTDPDVRFSLDLAFRLERLLGDGALAHG
ncbi:hypothetical protein EOS_10275 [Caballeronia mineralivorans PML1(12)]|uniref:PucR C-terminal helix-turn-helix domain-containing protein n=1 Tax=Caballeronia mineralivorans PML1(12) TaxID=908627 RepID=A0A0J1D0K4_9BURK|nr:helix-turn-helix domain-containing protein [Caballeronia mineralivorans]KLU26181.1 hypothetical protein EOS_10275 [Caballeronia mineralivorans PML1(12)]